MAQLEGITIKNYRSLSNVTLGKTYEFQKAPALPRLMAIIGPNGSGKSSLMDALGFLGDCLRLGVEDACDQPHRGGFRQLRTRGQSGPIEFEIYYRQDNNARPISYSLHIDLDNDDRPYVAYERLRQRRKGQKHGRPHSFLELKEGEGEAWTGESTATEEGNEREAVRLKVKQRLGITTLGNLADHPRIVEFRQFLEGWYLSYFIPDAARNLPMTGAQKHLNRTGDNLANYLQFIARQHPTRLKDILHKIAHKIPGIVDIAVEVQKDGRLLLNFNEQGFADPFYQHDMSDGSLKMLAYLLLFEDPSPAPLIGIEEPENGLYHQLLEPLAHEMKEYARRSTRGSQILVTTHSPFFVDALAPDEVWILRKSSQGFTTLQHASEVPGIQSLHNEGVPMGSLWYSNYFSQVN